MGILKVEFASPLEFTVLHFVHELLVLSGVMGHAEAGFDHIIPVGVGAIFEHLVKVIRVLVYL